MCVCYIVRVSADVAFHTTAAVEAALHTPQYKPMHSINTRAPSSFTAPTADMAASHEIYTAGAGRNQRKT
jgi:hypothetical protein